MPTLFTTIFGMLSVLMFGQLQERQYKASLVVQVSRRGHPPIQSIIFSIFFSLFVYSRNLLV